MPPKDRECDSNSLLLKDKREEFIKFTEIKSIDIACENKFEMVETSSVDDIQFEINFKDIMPEWMTMNELLPLLIFGYDVARVKQNNWRKMHGISMRRERYGV